MDDRTYKLAVTRAFGKAQKKINKIRAKCFYPGCSHEAVESHSQQKLGQLRAIAEKGEVYAVQRNHYQFLKNLPNTQHLIRTGISEASTFKGFCATHDKVVFSPIELQPLDPSNKEQAFTFFIRAFSYEFAQKRRMLEWSNVLIDEVRNFIDRNMLEYFEGMRDGKAAFFSQDAPYYMDIIFSAIERKDYSPLTTIWKVVDKNLGISSCCTFSPLLDEHDNHMKKTWGTPQPMVSFNLIPSENTTHVVTSWLPNSSAYCNWVTKETNSKEGLSVFINKCAFAESEDTCIRPSFWETLPEEIRNKAEIAMWPNDVRGQLDVIPPVVSL